jgi:antitoxin HigA-1
LELKRSIKYFMQYQITNSLGTIIKSDITLHPGVIIEMELEERGLKKKFFAEQLGISPSQLSELINEKRHISANIALKLEQYLGIDAEYWMRVQSAFDIAVARKRMAVA